MCSSKKGVSAHQLHRTLDMTYEAAWFMAHRIREAMRAGGLAPLGGNGKIVEADETYYGKVEKPCSRRATSMAASAQTGNGPQQAPYRCAGRARRQRSHVPCSGCRQRSASPRSCATTSPAKSRLHTDESNLYPAVGKSSKRTRPSSTARANTCATRMATIHTNSAEGYFSIFKRGMRGVYQHCKEKHLHRYLAEYDFRYNHRIALGYQRW